MSRRGWLADSPADSSHDSSLEERGAGDDESLEPIEEEVEESLEPLCYWFRVFQSHHQGWANLDQAHEDLDRNIFRDLSPTPKP